MLDTEKIRTGLHAHTYISRFNTLQMSKIPLNVIQENFPNSANDFNGKKKQTGFPCVPEW